MKKRLSLILVFILLFSLVGCKEKLEVKKNSDLKEDVKKADTVDRNQVFVSPEWIKSVMDKQQEESQDYIILEASWGKEKASPDYMEGHIEGAIHVNTDSVEEDPVWNLKSPEELEKSLLDLGITKDTTTIIYGKNAAAAARVAHAYLWAGVENVKILNGNIETWKSKGYEVEKKINKPIPVKDFGTKVPAKPEYILSIDEVAKKLEEDKNFKLVSVRAYNEYIGETSGYTYIPKAGEPKGAIWGKGGKTADTNEDFVHKDGTFINLEEMINMWKELGFEFDKEDELSFYCGTGWRAAIPFLILYENGYNNMNVYDGGWLEWQLHDELPVQVGDPKGDVKYTTVGELSNDKAIK